MIVEQQMQSDDETTAVQLQRILADSGHALSLRTILRSRSKLGWTFRGSAYCQLICDTNKEKRLKWAQEYLTLNNQITDVVCTRTYCTGITESFTKTLYEADFF